MVYTHWRFGRLVRLPTQCATPPRFARASILTQCPFVDGSQSPVRILKLLFLLSVRVQQGVTLALQSAGLRRRAALRRLCVAQPLRQRLHGRRSMLLWCIAVSAWPLNGSLQMSAALRFRAAASEHSQTCDGGTPQPVMMV
jgi:hypothetical protein